MGKIRYALAVFFLLPAVVYAAAPHASIAPDPISTSGYINLSQVPLLIHVNFSVEPAVDFATSAVALTNATLVSFATSSGGTAGANFDLVVMPTDGEVNISVPDGVVHDENGNGNAGASLSPFVYDGTVPAMTFTSTTTSPTGAPIFIIATTTEPINGFGPSNIIVVNGAVTGFAAASSTYYSFLVTPTTDGTTSISIALGAFKDIAGNSNDATVLAEYYFADRPLASVVFLDAASSTVSQVTTGDRVAVSVTFSEPVADTSTTTITVRGVNELATTSMTRIDSTHYLYVYTAGPNSGSDTITIDGAQDLVGNPQTAASSTLTVVVPPPAPSGGGGGGGGGGGPAVFNAIIPQVPTQTQTQNQVSASAAGEVLGVQTYRFTKYLIKGSKGDAVLNLQKFFIAKGLLSADSNTGYFGVLTQAAVVVYQGQQHISATGTVGPVTRAALNKENISF